MIQFSSDKGIDVLGRSITDRTLIRTSWILPLVSVLLATVIHYFSGNYRDVPFFISETDHPGIEDHVFSIGLFCSSVIQLLVSIRLYFLFKPIASPKLHHIALVCGIATSTHLSVLAFVTMDQNIEVHVYTAFIVFHGGFAWAFATHFSLPKSNSRGRTVRIYSLLVALVSLLVMTFTIRDGIQSGEQELGVDASNVGLDYLQPWVVYAAPAEYFLFFGLIACLASFSWDIQHHAGEIENTTIES
jgi:hypothetical protein